VAAILVAGVTGLAGCGSSKGSSTQFEVSTSNGQVSLSLNGKLPPHWPANAPVPHGAKPAGSASLVGKSNGVLAGVYTSRQSPEQVYEFYTTDKSITTSSQSSAGSGSSFVGRVSITAPIEANVTIVPYKGGSAIVMILQGVPGPSTTPTTIPEGSSGRR
jgi:hypothetical protein